MCDHVLNMSLCGTDCVRVLYPETARQVNKRDAVNIM